MKCRVGFTIPFGACIDSDLSAFRDLADAGSCDAWSSEVSGADAFTPLTVAAIADPRLRLGTAIVPVFTRSPTVIAQSAAALSGVAPGRFLLGIGASSKLIVDSGTVQAMKRRIATSETCCDFSARR